MTTFNLLPVPGNNNNARRAQAALDELAVVFNVGDEVASLIGQWRAGTISYTKMVGDIRHQLLPNYNTIERRFRRNNRPSLDDNRAYNLFREAVSNSISVYILDFERDQQLRALRQARQAQTRITRLNALVSGLQDQLAAGQRALGLIRRFQSAFLDGSEADVDDVGEAILEFDE